MKAIFKIGLTRALMLIFGGVAGVSDVEAKDSTEPKPPEITEFSEPGTAYVDLGFLIRSRKTLSNGAQILRLAGLHHGREVEVALVLDALWKKGPLSSDGRNFTYRGTVTWRSLGTGSNALLRVLDTVYQTKLKPQAMRPKTTFTGVSLEGVPTDLTKGATLFEPSVGPETSLYLNIMDDDRILEIREKDHGARAAFIKALRAD